MFLSFWNDVKSEPGTISSSRFFHSVFLTKFERLNSNSKKKKKKISKPKEDLLPSYLGQNKNGFATHSRKQTKQSKHFILCFLFLEGNSC